MIKKEIATLAGGCFWCIESSLDGLNGVLEVISGYTGGETDHPTYEQVTSGRTGHYEAVQVVFDSTVISFPALVRIFFQQIDPTDSQGSFVDRGTQYRSAVFYHDETQKKAALDIIDQINCSRVFDTPVATQVLEFKKFHPAELYHQDYHRKNPVHYNLYRAGSGRDFFIDMTWKKKGLKIFR